MTLLPKHKENIDKELDKFFGAKLGELNLGVINTLAKTAPIQLLPILAKSFDVDIDGLDEQSARELIANAFEIHYYSGTFNSLDKALKALYSDTKVKEWFDYNAEPYHFKLEFEASQKGINLNTLKKSDEIVEAYKNVRSVFDGATIKLSTKAGIKAASVTLAGESITVYPYQVEILETKMQKRHATTFRIEEIMEVKLDARVL